MYFVKMGFKYVNCNDDTFTEKFNYFKNKIHTKYMLWNVLLLAQNAPNVFVR